MDPLRPFLSLVRSLWTRNSNVHAASRARSAKPPHTSRQAGEVESSQPIEGRLRSHLHALTAPGAWNAQRAREVFVRQVLLHELGEELAADTAFSQLIQQVSGHLGDDPRISSRLDHLLREIAART